MATKIDYTYDSKKETVGQYNDRIESLRGSSGNSSTINSPDKGVASDEFTQLLQEKLMGASDAVSSFDTEIESSIQKAIAGIQGSREASANRIESVYNREIGYTKDIAQRNFTTAQQGQRGYAMQVQALRNLTESTEKDVNDLEQRKQEAISLGDAEAASKIADLQLQSLQYKQKAQQDVFQNLLALGGFAIQTKQLNLAQSAELRAQDQFNFQKEQAIGAIGLQYGLDMGPNDTISSMIEKAKPFASEDRRLAFEKAQAEISQINASIANLKSETAARDKKLSVSDIANLAKAAAMNPNLLGAIDNYDTLGSVINEMSRLEKEDLVPTLVRQAIANGDSIDTIIKELNDSSNIQNKTQAAMIARKLYEEESPAQAKGSLIEDFGKSNSPLLKLWFNVGNAYADAASNPKNRKAATDTALGLSPGIGSTYGLVNQTGLF